MSGTNLSHGENPERKGSVMNEVGQVEGLQAECRREEVFIPHLHRRVGEEWEEEEEQSSQSTDDIVPFIVGKKISPN